LETLVAALLDAIDSKDVAYLVAGVGLMGLTTLPLICSDRPISIPLLYVLGGALLALSPFALPVADPLAGELSRFLIDHATEMIVIIALAAAGLSIDRQAGKAEWQHAWGLLAVTMPLTIAGIYLMGVWSGLSVGAAMLLAAAMAPTDPVLARSVQVGGPNEGDEDDVRLSLTAEAGLNDGLAFPFVWLAVALAATGATTFVDGFREVGWDWLGFDVGYRIAVAIAMGWGIGWMLARFVMGRWGDAAGGGRNAGLVFLGTTFVAYGATEALEGYGFLAVFLAARAGRALTRGTEHDGYIALPHAFGDQAEKVLLALLLIWLGSYAASGLLSHLTWTEVGIALAILFVLRPAAGMIGLSWTRGDLFSKVCISFFGIRGMGTFFYLAFGMGHAAREAYGTDDLASIWRIAVVTVLISIAIHGALAPIAMGQVDRRRKARRRAAPDGQPAE
jgi:NhaP-type Na+/H+ or K+/H+ antiporter